MVNPTLIPDTVKGYLLPRKISTPSPATDANDEIALGKHNGNPADFGMRRCAGVGDPCPSSESDRVVKLFPDLSVL